MAAVATARKLAILVWHLLTKNERRETHRNVELMWLTGRLTPDFKTIADFRKDNGPAIRGTCRQFIALCRQLGLFAPFPLSFTKELCPLCYENLMVAIAVWLTPPARLQTRRSP